MIRPASIRRSLLAVLGICVLVGVVQGVLWAFTAPGIPYKVLADGRYGALPTTSTYHFVDVAVFALSGVVIGIVLAVGAWHVRAARGWQMILTLVGGSLLGAIVAWLVGGWLAPGTDPATVGASAADSIVIAAPTTGTILVVLAQPAMAAAVYTFLVAWNGRPDLGTGIPQPETAKAEPLAASPVDPAVDPAPDSAPVPAPAPERIAP
jgi:hypothetical protein